MASILCKMTGKLLQTKESSGRIKQKEFMRKLRTNLDIPKLDAEPNSGCSIPTTINIW